MFCRDNTTLPHSLLPHSSKSQLALQDSKNDFTPYFPSLKHKTPKLCFAENTGWRHQRGTRSNWLDWFFFFFNHHIVHLPGITGTASASSQHYSDYKMISNMQRMHTIKIWNYTEDICETVLDGAEKLFYIKGFCPQNCIVVLFFRKAWWQSTIISEICRCHTTKLTFKR